MIYATKQGRLLIFWYFTAQWKEKDVKWIYKWMSNFKSKGKILFIGCCIFSKVKTSENIKIKKKNTRNLITEIWNHEIMFNFLRHATPRWSIQQK